jgi:hypothetical protein
MFVAPTATTKSQELPRPAHIRPRRGRKIWPLLKAVAEANNCIPHMLEVLNAARNGNAATGFELASFSRWGAKRTS